MILHPHKIGDALGIQSDSGFPFREKSMNYTSKPSLADELGVTTFDAMLQCLICSLTHHVIGRPKPSRSMVTIRK
jgi:hypothetical protein